MIPVDLNTGRHEVRGPGSAAWAARYDDDGKLVEAIYPNADGTLSIPTAGKWWVAANFQPTTTPTLSASVAEGRVEA